jgi:hypothetical protein
MPVDATDDAPGIVEWQIDAAQLTLALDAVAALVEENREYDRIMRQDCEVLQGFPTLNEARWDFPLRHSIELETPADLREVHQASVTAVRIANRLLLHIQDELAEGLPIVAGPSVTANEAQQTRRTRELNLLIANLSVVQQVVEFRLKQHQTYTALGIIVLRVIKYIELADIVMQEERTARERWRTR